MTTPRIMLPASNLYRHCTEDVFVGAYNKRETQKLLFHVGICLNRIRALNIQLSQSASMDQPHHANYKDIDTLVCMVLQGIGQDE